jgi:hypothetical protein
MEGKREATKTSVKIVGQRVEIRTKGLLNTNAERYRHANLLASVQ